MWNCRLLVAGACVSALASPACTDEDDDHPPPPPLAGGGSYFPVPPDLVGGSSGDGDGDGDGDEPSELIVSLAQYESVGLSSTAPYEKSTVVSQIEPGGAELVSATIENATGNLQLAEGAETFWLSAYPSADRTMIPTITSSGLSLDGRRVLIDRLVLMPEAILDDILATTSSNSQRGGAQLLLQFVDSTFRPLPGVRVEYVEGGLLHTYASGHTWDENQDRSDARGLCLYYDIPSSSFPGELHEVRLSGAIVGSYDVQLAQGAVTVATFRQGD